MEQWLRNMRGRFPEFFFPFDTKFVQGADWTLLTFENVSVGKYFACSFFFQLLRF